MAIPGSDAEGGGVRIVEIPIPASVSWTPPAEYVGLMATVHCVGPGGSGGCGTTTPRVTGGGAGGHTLKRIQLANVAYTATVSAGGARVVSSNANGNPGAGNTSFAGDGHNIIAAPGNGGNYASAGTAAGATGGGGSGGDVTYTGGGSGDVTQSTAGSGGGSIGWNTNGFDSGDATTTQTYSGGAGLGGPSPLGVSPGSPGYQPIGGPGIVGFGQGRYFGEGGVAFQDTVNLLSSKPAGMGAGTGAGRTVSGGGSADASVGGGSGGYIYSTAGYSGAGGDGMIIIEIEVPI